MGLLEAMVVFVARDSAAVVMTPIGSSDELEVEETACDVMFVRSLPLARTSGFTKSTLEAQYTDMVGGP